MFDIKKIEDDFRSLINTKRLSHAYLFFGNPGVSEDSKFIFARSLANFLEKREFKSSEELLTELLTIEKDDNETVGIDAVKVLKKFLYQKPINSKYRTAIIKDSEKLTIEAQNAVLKIVEEPPKEALIIFIANSEENLYSTLASRLQKIYFPSGKEKGNKTNLKESESYEDVEKILEAKIGDLKKDPVKNYIKLKEILKRFTLMKQLNTNKRLQLRALEEFIGKL